VVGGCLWPRWRRESSSQIFRFIFDLSHEHDSSNGHNSHNYDRIARERDRRVIQKMWWEEYKTVSLEYSITRGFSRSR